MKGYVFIKMGVLFSLCKELTEHGGEENSPVNTVVHLGVIVNLSVWLLFAFVLFLCVCLLHNSRDRFNPYEKCKD